MNKSHKKILRLATPYLRKGEMKDFVVHTEGVVRAMEILLKKERADGEVLIPSAILHDVGWSKVPSKLLRSRDKRDKKKALDLHIEYAPIIIRRILEDMNYNEIKIKKIIDIVAAHKLKNPKAKEKKLLIDADNLSDAFKKQFYSDVRAYKTTPPKMHEIRMGNKFFTQTGKEVFNREMKLRKKEFSR